MRIDWVVYRIEQSTKGTISVNLINCGDETFNQFGYNVELPFESNNINVSAIPSGVYTFTKRISEERGCYLEIHGVPRRTNILVHVGNFMKDTKGCIMPCLSFNYNRDTKVPYGASSRTAHRQLYKALPASGTVHVTGIA